MNKEDRHSYEFAPFRLEAGAHRLLRNGEPVALTPKVFDLLLLMVENQGRVLTKAELMEQLWPGTFVEESSLPRAVSTLRQALAGDSNPQEYIETIPKRGYRFVADVRETRTEQEEAVEPSPAVPTAESAHPVSVPAKVVLRRWSGPLMISVLLFVASIALITVWSLRLAHTRLASTVSVTQPSFRRSIAVLGFRNVSGRAADAWLSTALSEMLTTELAAGGKSRALPQEDVGRLRVDLAISNSETLSSEMLTRIHARLGADLLVTGTYVVLDHDRQSPVRLDLRIQDAASGAVVASAVETGRFTDLFEIVSRASARLRDKLQMQELSREEAENSKASMPLSSDARRLYAQGLDHLRSFDLLAARDLFEGVIAVEPGFPLAHMQLAETWSLLGYDVRAKEEARKAFDLAGSLSQEQRLWIEGRYREMAKEWDLAIQVYRRLWGFFPDDADYGLALVSAQTSAAKQHDALAVLDALQRLPVSAEDRARIGLSEALASDGFDQERELKAARRAKKEGEAQNARLLIARASLLESYALGDGGQEKEAIGAAVDAQHLFTAVGDRVGYARALIYQANVLRTEGHFANREALYGEALKVCRQIGNKRCEAVALNNLGGVFEGSGDSAEAEKRYEESLLVLQAIDDKGGAANALSNIGTLREFRGDLLGATKAFEQALTWFKTMGSKSGQSLALLNISGVLELQGNLIQARRTMEESLVLLRDTGAKGAYLAGAVAAMADIQFLQGDLDGAEKLYEESLSMTASLGEDASPGVRAQLAGIWIERNRLSDAEKVLRESRATLRREQQKGVEILANTLLLKALLREGKIKEAQAEADAAAPLASDTNDKMGTLPLTIAMAQVRAAVGNNSEATKTLRTTLDMANRYGFVEYAFEARLALGQIEIKSGMIAGRARLQALQSEARSRGFGEIAMEAQQSLNVSVNSDTAALHQHINRR